MTAVSAVSSLDLAAAAAEVRWRRAVDRLWREVLARRNLRLADLERKRVERRIRNLRKVVRRALSEYHRIELERSSREPR